MYKYTLTLLSSTQTRVRARDIPEFVTGLRRHIPFIADVETSW